MGVAHVELGHLDAIARYQKRPSAARQILKVAVPMMTRDGRQPKHAAADAETCEDSERSRSDRQCFSATHCGGLVELVISLINLSCERCKICNLSRRVRRCKVRHRLFRGGFCS